MCLLLLRFFFLCIILISVFFWVFWPWLCSYFFNICKQGQLDVELNETGRQQAVAVSWNWPWLDPYITFLFIYTFIALIPVNFSIEVADRLSRESKVSIIYSSDLQRAFETAQVIASKCGGVEVRTQCLLNVAFFLI